MPSLTSTVDTILATRPDPLGVRRSTADVIYQAQHLSLHLSSVYRVCRDIQQRLKSNKLLTQSQFGTIHLTAQRIFLQDVVNFCFWGQKGQDKWRIEFPRGVILDGWIALVACFDRALTEGIPILDASYLANISLTQTTHLFRNSNGIDIPLLTKRQSFLQEAGNILQNQHQGNITHLLQNVGNSAPAIAKSIIQAFPSFEDAAIVTGQRVYFYKRAQVFAYDLSLLPNQKITNLDELTLFADYKLPQVFRSMGIIRYNLSLAKKVEKKIFLEPGSREEVEIRAATIWAGELIAHHLGIPPVLVDNILWYMVGKEHRPGMKPYHRTLTTSY